MILKPLKATLTQIIILHAPLYGQEYLNLVCYEHFDLNVLMDPVHASWMNWKLLHILQKPVYF